MTKEEILDYVTNTPENTNRLVLNDMIDELINTSSGGNGLIVHMIEDNGNMTLDKTWKEIYDAVSAARPVSVVLEFEEDGTICKETSSIVRVINDVPSIGHVVLVPEGWTVDSALGVGIYIAATENDYPVYSNAGIA